MKQLAALALALALFTVPTASPRSAGTPLTTEQSIASSSSISGTACA